MKESIRIPVNLAVAVLAALAAGILCFLIYVWG